MIKSGSVLLETFLIQETVFSNRSVSLGQKEVTFPPTRRHQTSESRGLVQSDGSCCVRLVLPAELHRAGGARSRSCWQEAERRKHPATCWGRGETSCHRPRTWTPRCHRTSGQDRRQTDTWGLFSSLKVLELLSKRWVSILPFYLFIFIYKLQSFCCLTRFWLL